MAADQAAEVSEVPAVVIPAKTISQGMTAMLGFNDQVSLEENKEETSTDDLRGDLNKTLVKADRNFYTDSNMFTKNDFEDFSTLTKELKKSNKTKKIVITLIILIILGVLAYFGVTKFLIK